MVLGIRKWDKLVLTTSRELENLDNVFVINIEHNVVGINFTN